MLKKLNTWKRNDKKIDEARKKLNDSVGLGRRDSIEYLAPGESGRAEDEAGVVRSEVVVKVQANNLGLGLILELAPHDGNVVIDIWEQGGISKFHNDIRPGDILCQVRKLPQTPEANEKAARRDGDWAVNCWGTDTAGWIDCRHKDISKVLRQNHMDGTRQVMHDGRLQVLKLQFGVLRLADSEERAD